MLPVMDPRAAAVDVGSEKMFVSVAGATPKVFGTCTADLRELVGWLQSQQVSSVAMEATGIYWLCLYEALEAAGLKAIMVNGRHVKNLPGRKTDWQDSQWLARLHCMGLLRGGFVPPEAVRVLRDYQRLRADHVRALTTQVLLMHKALERMNIKVQDVLSSLSTASGLRIVRAIVDGVRDPAQLAALCDAQVLKRKRAALLKSLEARWHDQHLFALRQALEAYDFYQRQVQQCDGCIQQELERLPVAPPPDDEGRPPPGNGAAQPPVPKEMRHNAPKTMAGLHQHLVRLYGGNDLSQLPAMTDYTVLQLLAELGTDLSAWPSEKHFTAWLGLAPGNKDSGKRKGKARRHGGQAGRIFRVAARALSRAKNSWLGAFYRRIRAMRGGLVANKAAARKMAELFYRCVTKGWQYAEEGLAAYEQRYREQRTRALSKQAAQLGLQIITPSAS
jgi:transposase